MKKVHAQAMMIIGILLVIGGFVAIGQLLLDTKTLNENSSKPQAFIVAKDLPLCNCDVDHSLAWNGIYAIVVSAGAIMALVGVAQLQFLTRRGR